MPNGERIRLMDSTLSVVTPAFRMDVPLNTVTFTSWPLRTAAPTSRALSTGWPIKTVFLSLRGTNRTRPIFRYSDGPLQFVTNRDSRSKDMAGYKKVLEDPRNCCYHLSRTGSQMGRGGGAGFLPLVFFSFSFFFFGNENKPSLPCPVSCGPYPQGQHR